jgi:hypothetical protein
LIQDVVFFDPPWGGENYWENDSMSLFLSDKPLVEVCRGLRGRASVIVLKVPWNFDFEAFQNQGVQGGVLNNFDKKEVGRGRRHNGRQLPKFVLLSMDVDKEATAPA